MKAMGTFSIQSHPEDMLVECLLNLLIARLRNHNATNDSDVDFRS